MAVKSKDSDKGDSYEKELSRFEEIIRVLSEGNVSLSQSVRLFKEGQSLSLSLKKKLDDFNGEILKLKENGDGFEKADIRTGDD